MKFSLFVHMERTDESQTYEQLYKDFVDWQKSLMMAACTPSGQASIMA